MGGINVSKKSLPKCSLRTPPPGFPLHLSSFCSEPELLPSFTREDMSPAEENKSNSLLPAPGGLSAALQPLFSFKPGLEISVQREDSVFNETWGLSHLARPPSQEALCWQCPSPAGVRLVQWERLPRPLALDLKA